jgi:predicted anti-sigma-YlaC factor YlaD
LPALARYGSVRAVRTLAIAALMIALLGLGTSCSVNKFVAGKVANSLTSGPDTFSSDEDPELIKDALPFGLKTMESLLQTVPKHRGLLLSLCRGYTSYAAAFVQMDADALESTDYDKAVAMRVRARKLYQRALGYGLRGLELDHKGIAQGLHLDPAKAVGPLRKQDLPMIYWTAAAWGSAIAVGKDQPTLLADLPAVHALIERGLVLDETYDGGSLHEAAIILDALPAAMGGSVERARRHFERAVELSKGGRVSPYVTMAQSVDIMTQNRAEFRSLLNKALAIDPDKVPSDRLVTLVLQQKARSLLARTDELFLEADSLHSEGTR